MKMGGGFEEGGGDKILDAGDRAQPCGGRRRRCRWTGAATGREERPHPVDGKPNTVQRWTLNDIVQGGLVFHRPIRIRRSRFVGGDE